MNNFARTYRELKVWQLAEEVFEMVCEDVEKFPKRSVAFIITNQLIRSVGSIGANIAEGFHRRTKKDLLHFFIIARASATESEVWIVRSAKRKFITPERLSVYLNKFECIQKMINSFSYKLRNSHS